MGSKKNNKQGKDGKPGKLHGARLLCIELDEVESYERNPRTTRNPEYERIRQSIESRGLEQPLIVTRRPGDDTYIVKAGGNTRLQILKELYEQTGDPEYGTVHCIEVGWEDEAAVLLAHLRENNLRGALSFSDQAAAVCAFAELLGEERQEARPSIRELRRILKRNGLPISIGSISRMRYAAEFLIPVMPVALSDGLGHRAVARISKLHRAASSTWEQYGLGSADEFDDIFAELCRRNDGPDWQAEPLRRAVETEIAEAADTSLQAIRFQLAFPGSKVDSERDSGKSIEVDESDSILDTNPVDSSRRYQADPADSDDMPGRLRISIGVRNHRAEEPTQPAVVQNRRSRDPFLSLRRRAYGVADEIARRFRMTGLVHPLPDCGYGFLLTDIPRLDKRSQDAGESNAATGTMWWQLLAFSDTVSAPEELIAERLPESSTLRTILLDRKLELLFDRIEMIEAAYFAEKFWSQLPKQDWQDWVYLAHTYREIRGKVIDTEIPLWTRMV